MRLPDYSDLIDEQHDVLETPFDESLFVAGPPGSGKTVLAVQRALMLAEANIPVALVTYNRMLRRLIALLTQCEVAAFTMHSYVGQQHYRRKTGHPNAPEVRRYEFDWKVMTRTLVERRVKPDALHLIVDEGQDLPKEFYEYARRFVAKTISVFADEDQALTRQRSTLSDIKRAAELEDPFLLTGNHRNTPEVARLAEHFHVGQVPTATVHRPSNSELPQLVRYADLPSAAERIALWQMNRGGSTGVVVFQNSTGSDISESLRDRLKGHRVDIYTSRDGNENGTNVLERGITILNKESIKGQEFDAVFITEVGRLLPALDDAQRRAMYMLCARARDYLTLMFEGSKLPPAILDALPSSDVLERR